MRRTRDLSDPPGSLIIVSPQCLYGQPSASDWIQLLSFYGPFALLVLFMSVSQVISYRHLRTSAQPNRRIHQFVFVGNWLVIFVLVGFSLQAWYRGLDYNPNVVIKTEPSTIPLSAKNIQPLVYDMDGNLIKSLHPIVGLTEGGKFMVPFRNLKAGDWIEIRIVVNGKERGTTAKLPIPYPNTFDVKVSP